MSVQPRDSIRLEGIEVFAYHGVLPDEKRHGQRFVVDIEVYLDLKKAVASDRLEDTVDYGRLAQQIHKVVASERWDLIETVAGRVADVGLDDPRVNQVTVTVHKPQAPIEGGFDDVAVTVTRTRG
jgi:7,8-dihydroneopterin aldolase/epimerase/oxygenase